MVADEKLLSIREVAELCTVSARKIWRDVAANCFPKPLKLGPKSTRWRKSEVLRHIGLHEEI